MGFLDLFRPAPTQASVPVRVMAADREVVITTPKDLEDFLKAGAQTGSGVTVTDQTALRVGAVFRCVSLISGAVATMPLHLRRRLDGNRREDASDDPLWRLLRRRPNPWQTPSQFRRLLQTHVLMRGHGFAMKIRRGSGLVTDLVPLNPDRVLTEQNDDLTLRFTYTRKDGRRVIFPQSDIFHLTGMSLDGVKGLSVLGCAREAVGLALGSERHGASMFKNGTHLGAVLKHPKNLGADALGNLKESMAEMRGADNAAKTLILEEGMDFAALGMSAVDAQWIEGRRFQRSDIAMFFGVPPSMIGETDKSTSWGSGIEQQSLGFVAYTLEDWLTMWEESIVRDLIDPKDDRLFPWFNRAALVKGDIKTRSEAYSKGRQWGYYTINDIRAWENMNPVDGGDDPFVGGNGQSTSQPATEMSENEPEA